VEYTSPKFGGFAVALTASAGEGNDGVGTNSGVDQALVYSKTYEGVVTYDVDNLHIGAGYSQSRNVADDTVVEGFAAAGFYTFGDFGVGLSYQHNDSDLLGKRDSVTATGMYTWAAASSTWRSAGPTTGTTSTGLGRHVLDPRLQLQPVQAHQGLRLLPRRRQRRERHLRPGLQPDRRAAGRDLADRRRRHPPRVLSPGLPTCREGGLGPAPTRVGPAPFSSGLRAAFFAIVRGDNVPPGPCSRESHEETA
jgi:hypothetical protein